MTTTEGRPVRAVPDWLAAHPEAVEAWRRCDGGLDVDLPRDMPEDCFAADTLRLLAAGATVPELMTVYAAWIGPSAEWSEAVAWREAIAWTSRRFAASSALDLQRQGVPTPGVTPGDARAIFAERPRCSAPTRRGTPCARLSIAGFACWQHEADDAA